MRIITSPIILLSNFIILVVTPKILPGNFATFSSLPVGELLSTNITISILAEPICIVLHSCIYCIPKSQFNSSHNPVFIGKCLDYVGNWPIILIIVSLQENNVSLLKVSSFPSARFSFLKCLNELLAPSCLKFIYCVLCSSPTFATVAICWSEASK